MTVTCIIVTYNGIKWIKHCLQSLGGSSILINVIVVDNYSTDGTVDFIRHNFAEVLLIEAGINLGFGRANNIGLEIALNNNADYVFLLNQDTWVEPDCIETLINVHTKHPSFGIVSPLHISGDNTSLEFKFIEYVQPDFCPGLISDHFMNTLKSVYETTFVNAAAWLISKDCLRTVGGFDPLYPHYGEDVDYIQRAKYFNYKTGIVPKTKIWHDSRVQPWSEIMYNKSRMITICFSELKDVNGSLRSNTLVFLKRHFDELTSHLLYRQFKAFKFKSKLYCKVLWQLNRISKARKASIIKGAFLNSARE